MNSYSTLAIEYIDILNADEECSSDSEPESTTEAISSTTEAPTSTTMDQALPTTETDEPDDQFCSKEKFDRIMEMLNKFKDECFNLESNICS